MTVARLLFLVFCLFAASQNCASQVTLEDAVILKDTTVIRGRFVAPVFRGGQIFVRRHNGKIAVTYWSEAAIVKRIPQGISDSTLLALYFDASGSKPVRTARTQMLEGNFLPVDDASGESAGTDIMILRDGTILRGILLETQRRREPYLLWALPGDLRVLPAADVRAALRLPRETTDSTITVLFVRPPAELLADNFRILTIFAGLSMPLGSYAYPPEEGGVPAASGIVAGMHASIRVLPTWRVAGTIAGAQHPSNLPMAATNFTGSGAPPPQNILWLLAGPELRTEGTSQIKTYVFAQAGFLFSGSKGFDFIIPATRFHPAGTGKQNGENSKGTAFCFGGGVSYGRYSLTGRWMTGSVPYTVTTQIALQDYLPLNREYVYDQSVTVISLVLGFSLF